LSGSPCGNEIKDVTHPQSLPANARTTSAFPRLYGDSFEEIH
jgi:hypothetical protein